ncbi:putative T7SS-secreted protein [Streptomyces sp. NPDC002701]|uniref:putative T7SS-secreted protein n=1 Tax=Streptomyces sp. NPDC002701 TaxID=3364661 RepID=UPI0036A88B5D
MTRPRADEWPTIGEASDPIPGDPEEVAKLGRDLRKTAESIRKQADEIKALSGVEAWKSKAADEFRKEAEEAEGKLRKAFKRYDAAADALGEKVVEGGPSKQYASELHRAQKMADKALRDAQDAESEQKTSTGAVDRLPKDTASDDPERKKLEKRQEAAASAMERAKKDLEAAKDIRDAAAETARKSIRYAIDNDGLKDGGWDKFKDWVHDNADWMKTWIDRLGWVATICGTLSLLVGWIPVIGQALAGILGTIALLATLVSLVGHLVLALAGEGSWFDVALDVVGLATFGIGRGAMAGARGAVSGAKSVARTAAYRNAMSRVTAKRGTAAYNRARNAAWKEANRLSGGALRGKAGAQALADAPKGWFPEAGRLAEAFNPKAIFSESMDSIKDLKAFKDTGDLFKRDTWTEAWRNGMRPRVGDAGLGSLERGMDDISSSFRSSGDVSALSDTFRAQTRIWAGATGIATFTDAMDKGAITGRIGEAVGVGGLDDGLWSATGIKDAWTTSDG